MPVVVHVFENTHMLLDRGVGGVNVHVNLRHMHMLRHVLGWGGVGCVNVRYIHMLRHVLGSGEWGVCVC